MVDELWNVAKVPGHAVAKMSDAEIGKKLQEVLATVNAGPGQSEIKIGKHNLKLTVAENGTVEKSSCKKPGFFSKVWSGIKKVAPIALTVASFIPVTAPFARAAQGVISLVQAIKAKTVLGIAAAGASLAGGFSKLAQAASRALQGVSQVKNRNWIGGLASIASAAGSGLKSVSDRFANVADKLDRYASKASAIGAGVASFDAYRKASRAVTEAKEALKTAQASGDAKAIKAAKQALEQAETQKRAAAIGGAAGAATAASALAGSRSLFPGQSKAESPARTALERNLQYAARALGVAQGAAGKDYARAAVSAFSLGATVNSAAKGGAENRWNDAANIAQAALDYHQAEKGRSAANQAVADAQKRLDAAKRDGNPELVQKAEADLKKAKRAAESAFMGGLAASESLLGTARDIGDRNRWKSTTEAGKKAKDRLKDFVNDKDAPLALREEALAEHHKLRQAEEQLKENLEAANGDQRKVEEARQKFDTARKAAETHLTQLTDAAKKAPPKEAPPRAAASAEEAAPPQQGLAAKPRPQRIGAATVTKGVTVWEISQRTGVPVERILEFNAQSGNPLVPEKLQIGQQILVPMDPDDIKFTPRTAEQVHELKVKAIETKRLDSIQAPRLLSSDEPFPAEADPRSRLKQSLDQDRALIAEGERSAEFKALDPSTWVDNKEEKARTLARNALREAVDHLDRVLGDPRSTDAQVQEALADKTTALSLYTSARFRADETNQRADFLTPAKEALQNTQAAVRTAGQAAADKIANLGLPEGVTFATTFPIHIVTEAADAALNLPIGAATAAQGIAGAIAHPIDTATGAAHLIDRAAQTTPEGRAFEFLAELSFGKYKTADEAARAFRDKTDGAAILGAKLDLTKDLAAGVFEESIKLAKEGRYGAALTNLFGENADVLLGIGPVRNLGRLERPIQIANDAEKAVKAAADVVKVADEATDLSKAVRTTDHCRPSRTDLGWHQGRYNCSKGNSTRRNTARFARTPRRPGKPVSFPLSTGAAIQRMLRNLTGRSGSSRDLRMMRPGARRTRRIGLCTGQIPSSSANKSMKSSQ